MPSGSRGKLFIIRAAFLRHVDDKPRFGPEPTFFMPLTTEDLRLPSSINTTTRSSRSRCAKWNVTAGKWNASRLMRMRLRTDRS
jgi:hypothetical protein